MNGDSLPYPPPPAAPVAAPGGEAQDLPPGQGKGGPQLTVKVRVTEGEDTSDLAWRNRLASLPSRPRWAFVAFWPRQGEEPAQVLWSLGSALAWPVPRGMGDLPQVYADFRQRAAAARGPVRGLDMPLFLVGGAAFDPQVPSDEAWRPFGPGAFWVPRYLALWRGARRVEAKVEVQDPWPPWSPPSWASLPSRVLSQSAWEQAVDRALSAMDQGELEKVVLARWEEIPPPLPSPGEVLWRLWRRHPQAWVFGVARQGRWLVGATPERLVELQGGQLSTMALAGTAPRGEGQEGAQRLLQSAKDRREHELVVRFLEGELQSLGARVEPPPPPMPLAADGVWHLYTPIRAHVREGTSLAQVAARLFPTPAVAGLPRQAALAWISRLEGQGRGWYAGPVGVLDPHGNGEFWVALRSALLWRKGARLYAGSGIVAGSEARAEWRETQLKMVTMRQALGE